MKTYHSHSKHNPTPLEINTLVALLSKGQYEQTVSYARLITENYPLYGFGWKVLGSALMLSGKREDALISMQRAAALSPEDDEIHLHLANAYMILGRLGEAEASYRKSLQITPDLAVAHYNLGSIYTIQSRFVEAESSYRRALGINPDFAEAHTNLGNTLMALNRPEEAEFCFRNTLKIRPDSAHAYNNLGNILMETDRREEAEANYRRALAINPDFLECQCNIALLLSEQGKFMQALRIIVQTFKIQESETPKSIFVTCIKHLRFTQDDCEVRKLMMRALTECWDRPGNLMRVGLNFVKLNPVIGEYMACAVNAGQVSAQDLSRSNEFEILVTDPLLGALLVSAPICDRYFEHFLTLLRRTLLDAATEFLTSYSERDDLLNFFSALTRQCFINEYVFSYRQDEIRKADNLRTSLVAALDAGTKIPILWLLAVASYHPLDSIPLAYRCLDMKWPESVTAVIRQQLTEPAEELQLRSTIPCLTVIDDDVSRLVQNQYEENPYPRWISTMTTRTEHTQNVVDYIAKRFPLTSLKSHAAGDCNTILIAGCGTGQHSIETALQFQGAKLLAIDLSLNSLGYAKRKTRELGLTSIEYAQADLLKLGSLGLRFDLIEAVGSLQSLADPWDGWLVLLSMLRTNGFMRLGFYSKTARRNIVCIKNCISEKGFSSSANDIRKFRQELITLDTNLGNTLELSDFFSMSTCRDLLFHVQEHRVTLADIYTFIKNNRLRFIGFDIDPYVLYRYKQRFSDDRTATNLSHWELFEHENPDTFIGMYQFWIQKIE